MEEKNVKRKWDSNLGTVLTSSQLALNNRFLPKELIITMAIKGMHGIAFHQIGNIPIKGTKVLALSAKFSTHI